MMKNKQIFFVLLGTLFFFINNLSSQIKFSENMGQWDEKILFKSTLDAGNLFVESNCLTFSLFDAQRMRERHHAT